MFIGQLIDQDSHQVWWQLIDEDDIEIAKIRLGNSLASMSINVYEARVYRCGVTLRSLGGDPRPTANSWLPASTSLHAVWKGMRWLDNSEWFYVR
jgi:hypothetical protein